MSKEYNHEGGPFGEKRKKKQSTEPEYQENNIFRAFIIGTIAFTVIAMLPEGLSDIADTLFEHRDEIIEKTETKPETKPDNNKNTNTSTVEESTTSGTIEKDTNIDADKVKEALDRLSDIKEKYSINKEVNTYVLRSKDIKNAKTYEDKIINKYKSIGDTVIFVLISDEGLSTDEQNDECQRIIEIATDNIDNFGIQYSVKFNSINDTPEDGKITIYLTITNE